MRTARMHAPPEPRRRVAFARVARLARTLLTPLALAWPPLFAVIAATRRASLATLGRDQGIFQYVGWAIGRGERDYTDIRDVNGPLTHLVHVALLALGGADEHRFRVLDLAVTGATYALVGACVPGLGTPDARSRRRGPPALRGLQDVNYSVSKDVDLLTGAWSRERFEAEFAQVSDPKSPLFHHFLSGRYFVSGFAKLKANIL